MSDPILVFLYFFGFGLLAPAAGFYCLHLYVSWHWGIIEKGRNKTEFPPYEPSDFHAAQMRRIWAEEEEDARMKRLYQLQKDGEEDLKKMRALLDKINQGKS